MQYVIVYRANSKDPWIPFCCSSGRFQFDAYESVFRARQLVQMGYYEAECHPVGSEGVYCRFYRTSTGNVIQEGGTDL